LVVVADVDCGLDDVGVFVGVVVEGLAFASSRAFILVSFSFLVSSSVFLSDAIARSSS
jgi:hypothetical protein